MLSSLTIIALHCLYLEECIFWIHVLNFRKIDRYYNDMLSVWFSKNVYCYHVSFTYNYNCKTVKTVKLFSICFLFPRFLQETMKTGVPTFHFLPYSMVSILSNCFRARLGLCKIYTVSSIIEVLLCELNLCLQNYV